MAGTQATLPILHRFLGIGQAVLVLLFLGLKPLGIVPLLPREPFTDVMAYVMSGIGVVSAAVALIVYRPQVPARPLAQSVEQYWATPGVGVKILPVWFLLEGAGIVSAVGFALTGGLVPAIGMGLMILIFWSCGPGLFEKAR